MDMTCYEDRAGDREDRPTDQTFPGLLRAHLRREQMPPEPSSGDQRAHVVKYGGDDRSRKEGDAVPVGKLARGQQERRERAEHTDPDEHEARWTRFPRQVEPRSTPIRYQSMVPISSKHHHQRDSGRPFGVGRDHDRRPSRRARATLRIAGPSGEVSRMPQLHTG